ncbi:MAG: hypothetical protein J6V82_05310, partial [Clostridia bacterium]|nr:hypothetical protein [Clostridia bacterium]
WGAIHAIYQIIGILTLPLRDRLLTKCHLDPKGKLVGIVRCAVTFILVDFAWLFFRANSTSDMVVLLRSLFTGAAWNVSFGSVMSTLGLTEVGLIITVLSLCMLWLLDRTVGHGDEPDHGKALFSRYTVILVAWCVMLAWTILMTHDLGSTFIYFQF